MMLAVIAGGLQNYNFVYFEIFAPSIHFTDFFCLKMFKVITLSLNVFTAFKYDIVF